MRTIDVKQTIGIKDESDDRAEWLLISLTSSISRPDEVFGRDTGFFYARLAGSQFHII
jgi:hypothetical protein